MRRMLMTAILCASCPIHAHAASFVFTRSTCDPNDPMPPPWCQPYGDSRAGIDSIGVTEPGDFIVSVAIDIDVGSNVQIFLSAPVGPNSLFPPPTAPSFDEDARTFISSYSCYPNNAAPAGACPIVFDGPVTVTSNHVTVSWHATDAFPGPGSYTLFRLVLSQSPNFAGLTLTPTPDRVATATGMVVFQNTGAVPINFGVYRKVALSSAPFTYQGQLRQNAAPVNGIQNFEFRMFGGAVGGAALTMPISASLPVSNGLFTTMLDFGNVFNGPDRWLEIAVNGSTLTPRQAIRQTPYATYAYGVPWGGVMGAPTSLPPSGPAGGHLTGTYPNPSIASNTVNAAILRSDSASLNKVTAGAMNILNGNVGIGIAAPTERLHVAGDTHVTGVVTKAYTAGTSNTAIPIAFGQISATGIITGTPNIASATWTSAGICDVSMTGVNYTTTAYTTIITPVIGSSSVRMATGSATLGNLRVRMFEFSGNAPVLVSNAFHFVVYSNQ